MKNLSHYQLLAGLFEYPDGNFVGKVQKAQDVLNEKYPEAGKLLQPFTDCISKVTSIEREELFTRSFDVQAVTTLDLGYIVFGEDYKRGELLVNLNREHREAGNDCGTELADHLTNVLRLLPKMKDEAVCSELVEKVLAAAVRKMTADFDPKHIEAKDKVYKKHHKTLIERAENYYTIYGNTLLALYAVLKADFNFPEQEDKKETSEFLKYVYTEIELEKD